MLLGERRIFAIILVLTYFSKRMWETARGKPGRGQTGKIELYFFTQNDSQIPPKKMDDSTTPIDNIGCNGSKANGDQVAPP